MKAILRQPLVNSNIFQTTQVKENLLQRFTAWLNTQEEKRFFWTALSLAGHGTFFTIITFATVILTGNAFALIAITCSTLMVVLAVNLAALPVKYIIPVFFGSLLVDVLVMVTAIALWI
jgi:hypothetical protein